MYFKKIRNFSIIAHIDHGKSTLADRIIEMCGAVEKRKMQNQILDSMDIERERGITIKAQTIRLNYKSKKDGEIYIFNIIDTPGHADFSYEVSKSLEACENSILVVDCTQGIEAQTLANVYKAIEANNQVFPVINKVDLPAANVEKTKNQIEETIGIDASNANLVSAKTGLGVDLLLETIVENFVPPMTEDLSNNPLKALLIDSWYNSYWGIVILIRIKEGKIKIGEKIRFMSTKKDYLVEKLGVFTPQMINQEELKAGEIGFITASIKELGETLIGDTITHTNKPTSNPFPGFKQSKSVVFAGFFPNDNDGFSEAKKGMEKLSLNDASFTHEVRSSNALGMGFRCGFLGLLHMEIIQERLKREFGLDLNITAPSVVYRIKTRKGQTFEIHDPADLPDMSSILHIEEPWAAVTIIISNDFIGKAIILCEEKRGIQKKIEYIDEKRAILIYELPLNEIITNFHDKLKSLSSGYASMDYEIIEFREGDLIKLRFLMNSEEVDGLSMIVHRSRAFEYGKKVCQKLKEIIPRHQFKIIIQAAIGGKIISRETINPYRKDVTAKLYGGDVTRKMKLLKKQKRGKKEMFATGRVRIPSGTFMKIAKMKD